MCNPITTAEPHTHTCSFARELEHFSRKGTQLMSKKEKLVQDIRNENPTAHVDFLMGFNENALTDYLDHLRYKAKPRNEFVMWIRRHETPAMLMRKCA